MKIRVLGLGNDLLADDAFGVEVARQLRVDLPERVEIASSIASGFALLDEVLGADRLIVVDTLADGETSPGTVRSFLVSRPEGRKLQGERAEAAEASAPGGSPHYVGLFETIALGRALGLHVPDEVLILAAQPADCLTIGGEMSPGVRAAIPQVMGLVKDQIREWQSEGDAIVG